MDVSITQFWRLLATYLRPHLGQVALLGALLLSTTALQLVNPQIVRFFIDTARSGGDLQILVGAALLFLAVAVVGQAVTVGEAYVAENVGWHATNALRADLAQRCLEFDLSFHSQHAPGDLIERVDGDVSALANFFSRFVVSVVGNALLLVGVLVLVLREDLTIGAVLLGFSALSLALLTVARAVAARYAGATRQASADLFGFLEERLSGLIDIQSCGAAEYVMLRWRRHLGDLFRRARTATLMGGILNGPSDVLLGIGAVAAFAIAASRFQAGALTLGSVFLIFRYTTLIRSPLSQIARQAQDFQRASASVDRVRQLRDTTRKIVDGEGNRLPAGALSVDFSDVSFRYNVDEPTLRHVSFHLAPGRVLGVVGRTGSGKSTLIRLIPRLYDADTGVIRVGDVDVRGTRLDELRERVSVVTQDVQLFNASIRDNMALFDSTVPDAAIEKAFAELGLMPWFRTLPHGLDTELAAGGVGLSAGESQLLALARVFLRNPGLVILDEASSRLDPATQSRVEAALDRLLSGRTAIVIAHRLETVTRADDILVLDDGRVVEYGGQSELARDKSSWYARLLSARLVGVLV